MVVFKPSMRLSGFYNRWHSNWFKKFSYKSILTVLRIIYAAVVGSRIYGLLKELSPKN
jgi:hypothetical protein